jgi:hypothetical protein
VSDIAIERAHMRIECIHVDYKIGPAIFLLILCKIGITVWICSFRGCLVQRISTGWDIHFFSGCPTFGLEDVRDRGNQISGIFPQKSG